jgi:DNA polymerase-3 subunit epsilon
MVAVAARSLPLNTPLEQIPFCVVDLETTGDDPQRSRITEIGAVRLQGGERNGSFRSLVNPGVAISPFVADLTGIHDAMVAAAPPIRDVLPSLIEFVRGSILVAHHAAFDATFLSRCLLRYGHDPLVGPVICTVALAKHLVRAEVPDLRLATLAGHFDTRVRPDHRALADAEACAEVLQHLLARATGAGLRTLRDLSPAWLRTAEDPVAATRGIPRTHG